MNQRGFTLIESIVYLALAGVLLGALLPTAYGLASAMQHDKKAAEALDEALLVDRRLHWALADAAEVSVPSPQRLDVTETDGGFVHFAVADSKLTVAENEASPATALNVGMPISAVSFSLRPFSTPADRTAVAVPENLTVDFTLGDAPFTFHYPLPKRGSLPTACFSR